MIPSSNNFAPSDALSYFPAGPRSLCLFVDMSFFGDLWNSMFLLSLTKLVNSVLGFLLWWRLYGLILGPVCIVNRITLKAWFTLAVRPISSPELVIIKVLSVCFARPTPAVPVCILGLNFFSKYLHLQNAERFVFFRYECTALIWFYFPGDAVKVDEAFEKFDNFLRFGWFAYSNSVPFSIPINSDKKIWFTGYMFIMLFSGKSNCISRPGSVNTGRPVVWCFLSAVIDTGTQTRTHARSACTALVFEVFSHSGPA